jgi:hypothetical protein
MTHQPGNTTTIIGRVNVRTHNPNDSVTAETTLELDSHADTCVVGNGALIINDFDRPVDVLGYDKSLGSTRYKTVSAVLRYVHPHTGTWYHLVINQAIHVPHLEHHLICPMQCRINGVMINDLPKFLDPTPSEVSHAILCSPHSFDDDAHVQQVVLPLQLRGVTSYLTVGTPTASEWTAGDIPRLILTSEHLTWDPQNPIYEDQEENMTDMMGNLRDREAGHPIYIHAVSTDRDGAPDALDDDVLGLALEARVAATLTEDATHITNGTIRSRTHKPIDYLTLAKRWCITPERARRTIDTTTQRGVRTCLYPDLSRRFPTNDRMLRYARIRNDVFTDTMFANIKSRRGNKCAQISMKLLIIELGLSGQPLTEDYSMGSSWMTHSWLKSVWEKVDLFRIDVWIGNVDITPPRVGNEWLMRQLLRMGFTKSELIKLN